ncbi:MAG: ribosome small subunit-dependent GTPase A [Clostridiales bacterium]|nr:ribosome small subunit-dependent GTPase A [Clostridiales bacterium]
MPVFTDILQKSENGTINGRIIKGIGGFYYIDTADGIFECRARGRFRKEGVTPLVGDVVTCRIDLPSKTGMITEIHPRKNQLIRPPVANVTQIAIVFSAVNPKPNLRVVDKLITSAVYADINPLICINKADLTDVSEFYDIYDKSGFDTIVVSAKESFNIDVLKSKLVGETTVFAGISGVGKSSLLNRIVKEADLETGEVSSKIERGRHTTRHSELMQTDDGNGYIIDTPGFSSFSVSDIDESELYTLFPDFAPYVDNCKFPDCRHTVEQGCAVIEAVNSGELSKSRHDSYLEQYSEVLDNKKY